MSSVPWPVVASFVAAVGTAVLVAHLWQYRDKPGATWFLASLSCQTVWSVAYGVALLVTEPVVREALEVVVWTAMAGTSVSFLGFALAYTGRGQLLEWWQGFVAVPVVIGLVSATNPFHELVWTGFELAPVAGMATVTYDMRLWAVAGATVGILLVSVGSLLLFDTVVSYGPLYRREAIAVGVSTVPPVVALLVWLYGVGPLPELNLATTMFIPHVVLDAYAFVGSDMFEFHPATRRAGERAAIDDLGAPVVIIDEAGRVVTLNAAAEGAFDVAKSDALTEPLDDLLAEDSVDPAADSDSVTVRQAGRQTIYTVTSTPLEDAGGTHVGYTVVFQDVTAERRREQRLNVLNRVLRHNLRNDMMVVKGFTDEAARNVTDAETGNMLDRASGAADGLIALGEKARTVEQVLDRDGTAERVELADLLDRVIEKTVDGDRDASVTVAAADVTATTDPVVLTAVLEEIIENTLDHAGEAPTVDVGAERRAGTVTISVADDGPGIPEHEQSVIDAGVESPLEHGSGLGLWLANWGATTLGGDLAIESGDDGTTVAVTLPDSERSVSSTQTESA